MGALTPHFEDSETPIDDAKVFVRFGPESLQFFVDKGNRINDQFNAAVYSLESHVDVPPKFIKAPIERGKEILIRHESNVPRSHRSVKKIYPA